MKRTSLKDIAEALHLSKATISWILSGQGEAKGFSQATIQRVKAYTESVGYRPNLLARSLTKGTTNTIGLVVPSIGDTFYAQLAGAIEAEAARSGYTLVVCSSEADGQKEHELLRTLIAKQVDGIIIAPVTASTDNVDFLLKTKIPFVLTDRYFPQLDTNFVLVNNEEGVRRATTFLLEQGAAKPVLITTEMHLSVMKDRTAGFCKAVADRGIALPAECLVEVKRAEYRKELAERLDELFARHPDTDGFFFATHYLAIEAIRYFIAHGIDYRSRFRLGCFHITTAFDILAPDMSICYMPIDRMGCKSVRLLLENIEAGPEFVCRGMVVDTEFFPDCRTVRE